MIFICFKYNLNYKLNLKTPYFVSILLNYLIKVKLVYIRKRILICKKDIITYYCNLKIQYFFKEI